MVTRKEIIDELGKYFTIQELVCDHTMKEYGQGSWKFLTTEFLHTVLVLRRDIFGVGMTCNVHGQFTQRGLRCNICKIVKDKTNSYSLYLSAHTHGAAGDFDVKGMTAEQARQKIHINQSMLPYPVRMEKGVTWLHIDTYDSCENVKVTYF